MKAKQQPDYSAAREDQSSAGDEFNNESNIENRSSDFGESGQFAPGGHYNQRGAAQPDRIDLDDELAPRRQLGNRQ